MYCLWNAREIADAWSPGSMYERYGWLLLLLWLLPFCYQLYAAIRYYNVISWISDPRLLSLSVLISLFGNIGEVHVLVNIGAAVAIAAFIPFSWTWLLWLLSGVAWIPQVSWLLSHLVPNYSSWYFSFRLAAILIGSFGLLFKLKKRA